MYTQTVNSLAFMPGLTAISRNFNSCVARIMTVILVFFFSSCAGTHAQQYNDTTYQKVLHERSTKIVAGLGVTDPKLADKITDQIARQYFELNSIHDQSKAAVATIKAKNLPTEEAALAIKAEGDKKSSALKQLHGRFIALLQKQLSAAQVEHIKDGMTYRVLPVTWAAYMDMLQNLTPEQKDKMYAWLVEARELAMDEGSSDAKHAVFGKYKGKINNYLSAAGYDMKKEGEEWQKRIEAAKKNKLTRQQPN